MKNNLSLNNLILKIINDPILKSVELVELDLHFNSRTIKGNDFLSNEQLDTIYKYLNFFLEKKIPLPIAYLNKEDYKFEITKSDNSVSIIELIESDLESDDSLDHNLIFIFMTLCKYFESPEVIGYCNSQLFSLFLKEGVRG